MNVAEYIADFVVRKNITTVFMITGGPAMYLNHAFGNHSDLQYVCNHHEQASAMAAEAFARVSGKPGVVVVTNGPGGTNAVTGVFGQYVDSIPCLYISGQVRLALSQYSFRSFSRQTGEHEAPILEIVRPITKYQACIDSIQTVKYHLQKAYYLSVTGRPGPVWLDVPLDIQSAPYDPDLYIDYVPDVISISNTNTIKSNIGSVVNELLKSSKPLILVGSGVARSNGRAELSRLIKRFNLPVQTAINAHDLISSDNPLFFGRPGIVGDRASNTILQSCDLLIIVGCRLNVRNTGYNLADYAPAAVRIMIDIDPQVIFTSPIKLHQQICCDARSFLDALGTELDAQSQGWRCPEAWVEWCREVWVTHPLQNVNRPVVVDGVDVFRFLYNLSLCIPDFATIVTGNGIAYTGSFQVFRTKANQLFFTNSGSAPMGFDLPAAIGAYFAAKDRTLVCITGDGSIQMNLQELQTIVHHNIPVVIFVLNNNGYDSMKQTQKSYFKAKFVGADSASGVSFPDIKKIAKAYKIRYKKIGDESRMMDILKQVITSKEPLICEVIINRDQPRGQRVGSRRLEDGRMVSNNLEDID